MLRHPAGHNKNGVTMNPTNENPHKQRELYDAMRIRENVARLSTQEKIAALAKIRHDRKKETDPVLRKLYRTSDFLAMKVKALSESI